MRYIVTLVIFFALIDMACTNRKKFDVKQPAPVKQTQQKAMQVNNQSQQAQPAQPAKQNNSATVTQKTEKAKYKYPDDNGIGPVKEVKLGSIDPKLVTMGTKIFNTKCMACHRMDSRLVGPPLRGITKKNTPVFIMNYLLNTLEMQKKDPILKKLVDEYKIVMPDQNLSKKEARAMLDFFRSKDAEK